MPRLPRGVSGPDAVRALERLGFGVVRQPRGSHIVMRRGASGGVVSNHREIKTGTLAGVLRQAGSFRRGVHEELEDLSQLPDTESCARGAGRSRRRRRFPCVGGPCMGSRRLAGSPGNIDGSGRAWEAGEPVCSVERDEIDVSVQPREQTRQSLRRGG